MSNSIFLHSSRSLPLSTKAIDGSMMTPQDFLCLQSKHLKDFASLHVLSEKKDRNIPRHLIHILPRSELLYLGTSSSLTYLQGVRPKSAKMEVEIAYNHEYIINLRTC